MQGTVVPGPPVTAAQPGRADRLRRAARRDGGHCVWCRRDCTGRVRATTDHLVPKVKGGPSWLENEVVACGRCNRHRGHTSPADWFAECVRRGWDPDLDAVLGTLRSLAAAIAERGGQRRARPYLDGQLRRLERLAGGS
ncbi:HNH endonuclease [Pseudonocardia spirodelae]|uniref:HNH endonuclease signature motif containing protein n=1 Tax=Pseudonocardia spirodelae TaxID=3133431 RepID=A0ABU8T3W1_9PSEU